MSEHLSLHTIEGGSITSVPGFRAAGVAAEIKKRGGLDLALIESQAPCAAAAVFTTNQLQAASVVFNRALLEHNPRAVHAVAINSGCANAVTGELGMRNVHETAAKVAQTLKLPADAVCVMSTGVIGQQLPMERLLPGIDIAVTALSSARTAGVDAARAIMTTDTYPKHAALRFELDGSTVTLGGMAKGSGMIHPNMATMLALVCLDAAVEPAVLHEAVRYAADRSFNCVSVDGDNSTNDTLLVLANGRSGATIDTTHGPSYQRFRDALTALCIALAKEIARDGEGATKFVTIDVSGARSWAEAHQIGRTIATSALTKTAIYGTDANWGRVLAAAGRAGVPLDADSLALWFGDVQLVGGGAPLAYSEEQAHATLLGRDVDIRLDLGLGDASATVWTCDFSPEYVSINADYRT